MKTNNIVTVLLVAFVLASCVPAAEVVPTETAIPNSTFTSIPPTPAIPPTLIPAIQVNSIRVPDPKYTNPELFDLQNSASPIPPFVNAMKMAGIVISPETVLQQIRYQALVQANGKPYVLGLYTLDPDAGKMGETLEGVVPLLMAFQDNHGVWMWKKTTIGSLGAMIAMNSGTLLEGMGSSDEAALTQIQAEEFNYGVAITMHKGGVTDNGPDQYDFGYYDAEVMFGAENNIPMLGHPLVWASAVPDWLKNGNYSNEQILEIMNQWITTVMLRYPQIKVWNVVNEAYTYNDFFRNRLGDDYFVQFYRTARQVRPDATLLYNDYGNHSLLEKDSPNGERTQITAQIIARLQRENLIDGVGVQMVIYADMVPSPEDVTNTLRSYGLPVYVVEFQVIMTNVPGSQEERWLKQAQIYYDMVKAIRNSGVCNTIIYWNQSDKFSPWENQPDLPEYSTIADPSLFDDNFDPKPAYYAVMQALVEPLP
jgi:endo-1,4-beta-xylanase